MSGAGRWTVLQLLPALQAGGAERSTLEVAAALVRAGHRSLVVSAGGALVAELEAAGSIHLQLPIADKSLRTLWQLAPLRALLRQWQPDLVHVRSRLPAWLLRACLATLPAHCRPRVVSTVHGLNSVSRYSAILARADRVICVSQTSAAHVRRHYAALLGDRLRVIPRGVDPARLLARAAGASDWPSLRTSHEALNGRPLLLLPGRGTRLKGHAAALRLLAELRAGGLDARLCLLGARQAGREAYLAELQVHAEGLGVGAAFAATAATADMAGAYADADLVLQLSSRPESFGRTVAEALWLGRPVLGWDLGGVGEQLRAAFPAGLVAQDDYGALTRQALQLLQQPPAELRIDRSAIATVAQLQQRTLAVYAELLAPAGDQSAI